MKFVLLFALAFVAVSARPSESEVDWANVISMADLLRKQPIFEASSDVQRDRRIVNGQTADPHQFPYQVKTNLLIPPNSVIFLKLIKKFRQPL